MVISIDNLNLIVTTTTRVMIGQVTDRDLPQGITMTDDQTNAEKVTRTVHLSLKVGIVMLIQRKAKCLTSQIKLTTLIL